MGQSDASVALSNELALALQNQTEKFSEYYLWLEKAMPPAFFHDIRSEDRLAIVHSLIGFNLQEHFTTINLSSSAIILCLDSPDADLRVLKNYAMYGIRNYRSYVSLSPLPLSPGGDNLRVSQLFFTDAAGPIQETFPQQSKEELRALVKQRNPEVTDAEFENIINSIGIRFLHSVPIERLILALDMFFRAQTRDHCQYEVRYNQDWQQTGAASMQIVLAWKNTPKHHFLYRMARIIHRYNLVIKGMHAAYIDPYSSRSILVMALNLQGNNNQAAWDVTDISDFLRELATVKYFASFDPIDENLVQTSAIRSRMGNFLRAAVSFVHQSLVLIDPNLYTVETIEEDLCRHPELTAQICDAFDYKFNPDCSDYDKYLEMREKALLDIEKLDTGHTNNDARRKNVLRQTLALVQHCYKTNYFRVNYSSISFRLDPKYLDDIPFTFDRSERFPELPYGIIFVKGMHFFGFQIRFRDLSRGGLRTVFPKQAEHVISERNMIFSECYNLAYTQHKKNKDIPEGGSKAIIFLKPFERLHSEMLILKRELESMEVPKEEIQSKLDLFKQEQEVEYLYQAQRAFVESLITIVNCEPRGEIRAKNVIDYWKRPEYIYLGPDENMHDSMIQWIADYSKKVGYKPGSAFISGKPNLGINHKEYGVTSLGLNIYLEHLLKYLGIDPYNQEFTVKLLGGPDGDVAGNEIVNLHKYFPRTAKLVALTDISGTIYDPEGLDLAALTELFHQKRPIKFYPPQQLHEGGFLVDQEVKRKQTAFAQQTLCWKMEQGRVIEQWLSGSEMNHLMRNNVHQVKADVFIPAGGRPRSLNINNIEDFLDETGQPTARGIVEGANLYLTDEARHYLEENGVLIIKDSSANKTGVICSSFEVLCGLVLEDALFMREKPVLVQEILDRLKVCATNEAKLLLQTHKQTGRYLTEISDQISSKINQFRDDLLNYFEGMTLPEDPEDPLIKQFFSYTLPSLRNRYRGPLLQQVPEHHKKAIIACHLAANLVYQKGLDWQPTVVDILPLLLEDLALQY